MGFIKRLNIILLLSVISYISAFGQYKITDSSTKGVLPTKYAIVLYSNQVVENKGDNQKMASHWVNKGGGSFKWQKEISESGEYEVVINYATKTAGSIVKVVSGKDSISAGLAITSGYYPSSSTDWYAFNCERKQIPGKLYLTKGINTVAVQLKGGRKNEVNLYTLELIKTNKKDLIKKDQAHAQQVKPNMKWFKESPYGLMFHWTSQSTPKQGALKPYQDAVNAFNVSAFVKMVQKTGASYVIFTTNHAEPFFPAPLKQWEKEYPGHTTSRDLIKEIADSLDQNHIKLILYLATHIYAKYDQVNDDEFERLNFSLLTEIGERYKKKVAGYWLDGWYQSYEKHPSFDFEKLYRVSKIGNPNRLLCLNSWVYPVATLWQDYWAGEVYTPGMPSTKPMLENGPGKGLQNHNLIVMETDDWLHTSLNTRIKEPSLKADDLVSFIKNQQGKAPVTINIQIYQDGSISDGALNIMETVREKLK